MKLISPRQRSVGGVAPAHKTYNNSVVRTPDVMHLDNHEKAWGRLERAKAWEPRAGADILVLQFRGPRPGPITKRPKHRYRRLLALHLFVVATRSGWMVMRHLRDWLGVEAESLLLRFICWLCYL
ncbi:unnamed protein product, partial [Iphiclides podalirius]